VRPRLRRDHRLAYHLYLMIRLCCLFALFFCLGCARHGKEKHDRQVFSYNEVNGMTTLDPAGASGLEDIWPINQLFNGLLEMDDSLNVRPSLAKKWKVSEDGKVYTFILRSDVHFHDDSCFKDGKGRKVTASDFVFTFSRLADARISSATSLLTHLDKTKGNSGVAVLADTVLQIFLERPFSAFPSVLTMKYFSVVPKEAIRAYGDDFRRHPVGTGPFVFKVWDEGTRLVLLRNPHYFEKDGNGRQLPYLDAVNISFMRDRETAFMELLNGKFDMLSGADAFNTNEVLDRNAHLRDLYSKKFYLQKAGFLKTDYLGILVDENAPSLRNSPLRIKALRQALNYAFDRKKLVKYLRNNLGTPALSGFIPPGMKSYDPHVVRGYTYDPAKVKELLTTAGFPEGKGLPTLVLHVSDNYREQVEFIQSQFAANHIKVEVSIEKMSVLRQAVNRGEYPLFKKSWVADYADEENFMGLFYSRNFSPGGVNYFHYRSDRFDRMYEEALAMPQGPSKIALYQEMERLLIEDAPYIAMYYDDVVRIVSKRISSFATNPMNLLNLKRVQRARD
jgi:oligopeptide transport system substrate-binding protein